MTDDTYPNAPGHANTDTSKEAAELVRPKAAYVKRKVLEALEGGPKTTMQIAHACRMRYETCQPRTSELSRMGLIVDSGERGMSRDPRKNAIIWKLAK